MGTLKRIHISKDDARRLEDRFWTLDTSRVDFVVVFNRANEVLDQIIADSPNILEQFIKQWVVEEANTEHEKEKP